MHTDCLPESFFMDLACIPVNYTHSEIFPGLPYTVFPRPNATLD